MYKYVSQTNKINLYNSNRFKKTVFTKTVIYKLM